MMTLAVHCSFCGESHAKPVEMDGWRTRYDTVETEDAFCPKHAGVEEFLKGQCPGCVSRWGNPCPLQRAFGQRELGLSETDFAWLRCGVCPKRVNGSLMVNNTPPAPVSIEHVNISTPAAAGGKAMADAIMDHEAATSGRAK